MNRTIPADATTVDIMMIGAEMFVPFLRLALDDELDALEEALTAASHTGLEDALGALLVMLVAAPGQVAAAVLTYRKGTT